MKSFTVKILIVLLINITFFSCDKDNNQEQFQNGNVTVEFDHKFGPGLDDFFLNKEYTHSRLNEKMTFTTLKYYVSNVRLKKTDGTWFAVPESYYLIDLEKAGGNKLQLENIPGGEYTDMEVMFGVDSTRNVSGAQTGALDPILGMFWSWNSGYIMLKAEGTSPASSDGTFAFHLGGYQGQYKVQKSYTYNLGKLVVDGDREAEIHMIANPARLWHAADPLATKSKQHMPGQVASVMTSAFYDGIIFDHVHN